MHSTFQLLLESGLPFDPVFLSSNIIAHPKDDPTFLRYAVYSGIYFDCGYRTTIQEKFLVLFSSHLFDCL